jgi:hypothetical protein
MRAYHGVEIEPAPPVRSDFKNALDEGMGMDAPETVPRHLFEFDPMRFLEDPSLFQMVIDGIQAFRTLGMRAGHVVEENGVVD